MLDGSHVEAYPANIAVSDQRLLIAKPLKHATYTGVAALAATLRGNALYRHSDQRTGRFASNRAEHEI